MRIISGWLGFLLSVFTFFVFLAGVLIQIGGSFYVGTAVVLLTLAVELLREVLNDKKIKKLRWRDTIGLLIGTFMSMGALMLFLLLTLVFSDRVYYILLLDTALSTVVFLLSSFIKLRRVVR